MYLLRESYSVRFSSKRIQRVPRGPDKRHIIITHADNNNDERLSIAGPPVHRRARR